MFDRFIESKCLKASVCDRLDGIECILVKNEIFKEIGMLQIKNSCTMDMLYQIQLLMIVKYNQKITSTMPNINHHNHDSSSGMCWCLLHYCGILLIQNLAKILTVEKDCTLGVGIIKTLKCVYVMQCCVEITYDVKFGWNDLTRMLLSIIPLMAMSIMAKSVSQLKIMPLVESYYQVALCEYDVLKNSRCCMNVCCYHNIQYCNYHPNVIRNDMLEVLIA